MRMSALDISVLSLHARVCVDFLSFLCYFLFVERTEKSVGVWTRMNILQIQSIYLFEFFFYLSNKNLYILL